MLVHVPLGLVISGVISSLGMVSFSSFQAPEEKAESAAGDKSFWNCCKCSGPKQDRPHTDTGKSGPLDVTHHCCRLLLTYSL